MKRKRPRELEIKTDKENWHNIYVYVYDKKSFCITQEGRNSGFDWKQAKRLKIWLERYLQWREQD